ncbi:unnamed protein product [Pedinophyceae sp. YPF-701]|nr:unnamed protein product [Pedinophyceae sp. YPF-701]
METLLGVKGKDFIMLCSDTSAVSQIITLKDDEQKILPIDSHHAMAVTGEPGDRVNFSEYIMANVRLYALRNSVGLNTKAIAHFTRGELATALRKSPYFCNLLIAGYDEATGASLYWMDYLATMHKMNIAGTGYGSYFVLSMWDKLWQPDASEEYALDMMRKGVAEIRKRLVVASPKYQVCIIDKNGFREVTTL